jgi:DNA-directed RNA polymerase specialized sigma24 family protein
MGPEQRTDAELMETFYAGDGSALDEIYYRYRPRLIGFFRRRGLSDSGAEDKAQDVLACVLLTREPGQEERRYDSTRAAFAGWLFGIAYFEFLHALDVPEDRPAARNAPVGDKEDGSGRYEDTLPSREPFPEDQFWEGWRRQQVHSCMRALPSREKEAVSRWLISEGAGRLRELAADLEVGVSTAFRVQRSAFQHMKECLEAAGVDDRSP